MFALIVEQSCKMKTKPLSITKSGTLLYVIINDMNG